MAHTERDTGDRGREERAVYIISVAAELAGMHPQTLRIYERKGLVQPQRTAGNTRRYSDRDIELLRGSRAERHDALTCEIPVPRSFHSVVCSSLRGNGMAIDEQDRRGERDPSADH